MPISNPEEMIVRQLDDKLTKKEAEELLNWYNSSEENRKLYRDYCVLLKAQTVVRERQLFEQDKARSWKRLKKRISQEKVKRLRLPFLKYAAVAAIALLVGWGGRYMVAGRATEDSRETQITVPEGSKSQVVLPDGTVVWLNSGSHLTYADDFGKTNRTVHLDGEGFFDVTKNRQVPFEVCAGETYIRVLGTRFNMKAYSTDEKKRVTLLSGSLSVRVTNGAGEERIIAPNEQAVIVKGSPDVEVRQVEAENYVSWTETEREILTAVAPLPDAQLPQMRTPNRTFRNTLFFDEEPLSQIVNDLSRAYNVTILLASEEIAANVYYGDFRNEEGLYQVLDAITSSGEIRYEVKDNQIIIDKNNNSNHIKQQPME